MSKQTLQENLKFAENVGYVSTPLVLSMFVGWFVLVLAAAARNMPSILILSLLPLAVGACLCIRNAKVAHRLERLGFKGHTSYNPEERISYNKEIAYNIEIRELRAKLEEIKFLKQDYEKQRETLALLEAEENNCIQLIKLYADQILELEAQERDKEIRELIGL